MIWGRTNEQKEKTKTKLGEEKVIFAYLPNTLKDGRWVWWEYVRCVYATNRGYYWSWREVVEQPAKIQIA